MGRTDTKEYAEWEDGYEMGKEEVSEKMLKYLKREKEMLKQWLSDVEAKIKYLEEKE